MSFALVQGFGPKPEESSMAATQRSPKTGFKKDLLSCAEPPRTHTIWVALPSKLCGPFFLLIFGPGAGQGRAGQGRAGQGRAGQGRAGQGRAGQGRAGQGRAGQGRAGQGRLSGHLWQPLTRSNHRGP